MKTTLGNVVDIILGGTPKTKIAEYWNGDIPWVTIEDFYQGKKICKTEKYITEFGLNNSNTKLLNEGDIIISARGTVGKIIVCGTQLTFSQSCYALRSRALNKLSQEFLYYLMWNSVAYLKQRAVGGIFNTIIKATLESVPIDLPPLPTQKRIADILSAYDDLIENNNRRIALLEQAARHLYKEWFVRFKFPGHEKVKIVDGVPEGWERRKLGEVANVTMGQSPKSEFYSKDKIGLPFHQGVTNFNDRFVSHSTYCTVGNQIAEENSILCSVRAPVGRLNISLEKIIIGRGLSAISSVLNHHSFLFYQLKNHFFKEDLIGGGAIYASVTKNDLLNQEMLVPPKKLITYFQEISNNIDTQIKCLYSTNLKLKNTRDLLLPKLISGNVEV